MEPSKDGSTSAGNRSIGITTVPLPGTPAATASGKACRGGGKVGKGQSRGWGRWWPPLPDPSLCVWPCLDPRQRLSSLCWQNRWYRLKEIHWQARALTLGGEGDEHAFRVMCVFILNLLSFAWSFFPLSKSSFQDVIDTSYVNFHFLIEFPLLSIAFTWLQVNAYITIWCHLIYCIIGWDHPFD